MNDDCPPPPRKSLFLRCLPWLGGLFLVFALAFGGVFWTMLPMAHADVDAVNMALPGIAWVGYL